MAASLPKMSLFVPHSLFSSCPLMAVFVWVVVVVAVVVVLGGDKSASTAFSDSYI